MLDGFGIKCKKCGNAAVDIKGTAAVYGRKVRVKFTCLSCGYEVEVPVTQSLFSDFEEGLRKKKEKETLGDLIRTNLRYTKDGKEYRKIGRYEIIEEGAMQSWCDNGLCPIQNPETIGDVPANCADKREFYNPV